jgi:hypothetical protein
MLLFLVWYCKNSFEIQYSIYLQKAAKRREKKRRKRENKEERRETRERERERENDKRDLLERETRERERERDRHERYGHACCEGHPDFNSCWSKAVPACEDSRRAAMRAESIDRWICVLGSSFYDVKERV